MGNAPGDEIELTIGRKLLRLVDENGEERILPVKVEPDKTADIEIPFAELEKPN